MDTFLDLLQRQDQVFRRDQALTLGITRHELAHQLQARRWRRVLPEVYVAHTGVPVRRQRLRAALLYAGDESALSRWTAAVEQSLSRVETGVVHVAAGTFARRSIPGLVHVHRLRHLRHHITEFHGFPILQPAWTVLDLCIAGLPERELRHLLTRGVRNHPTLLTDLAAELQRNPFRPGTAPLRRLVADPHVSRARAGGEVRLAGALEGVGMPGEVNGLVPLGEWDVREGDIVYRVERVVVQVESDEFHLDLEADVRRDDAWLRGGWTVVRVTNREVEHRLDAAVGRVVATLRHRRAELDLPQTG